MSGRDWNNGGGGGGRGPAEFELGAMFDLSDIKKVQVKQFNGKIYVDFREFFHARSGDVRPSKKGLALHLDQWEILLSKIEEINQAIANMQSTHGGGGGSGQRGY